MSYINSMVDTLAIVGVGLLGGSIALAARRNGLVRRILGVSLHEETLAIARQRGMIDEGYTQIDDGLKTANLAILCTPVDRIAPLAMSLLAQFPEMIVSDVGSTKAAIVTEVRQSGSLARRFVGGHPLAGSEKSGPEHAAGDLFQNRLMFLTSGPETDPHATALVTRFWQSLGSNVIEMEPDQHDAIMAMTSHLPHLASFVLGGAIEHEYLQYCGTGMRTMTRLAGGDPTMWTAIAMSNREHLLVGLDQYQTALRQFEFALQAGDASQLHQLFTQGRRTHHALGS